MVGRTEDWLSKIERGEREIRRLDVLVDLARALRVTLGDLLGERVLVEYNEEDDDVPAIRDALMAPQRLSRTLFSSSMSLEYIDPVPVARLAEGAWSSYQNGKPGRVVAALPGLITASHQMDAASADDAAYRRACAAVTARIHHLAATTLIQISEADLAWIAAERSHARRRRIGRSVGSGLRPPGRSLTLCWQWVGLMTPWNWARSPPGGSRREWGPVTRRH